MRKNMFKPQSDIEGIVLCEFTDGRELCTETGTYYLIEKEMDLHQINQYDTINQIDLHQMIFLDIESMGLRPSKSLFLVGLLLCRGKRVVLRQYLARHPKEEGPLLSSLAQDLANYQILITYNGKRFDLPYIEKRMAYHGLVFGWERFHIDLLWHAKKSYRGVLPDCRLITLEENILSQKRHDDVPGSRIPQVYNSFVKSQDPAVMQEILEHNALDLISLYKLLPILNPQRE